MVLFLIKITIFGTKIQIIQVIFPLKILKYHGFFSLKNQIQNFWIFLKIEFSDIICDFLTVWDEESICKHLVPAFLHFCTCESFTTGNYPFRMARENCNSLQYIEYSQAPSAQCLKIAEKVAFYNVSEASYVYILSGQKFIINAKKIANLASFWKT